METLVLDDNDFFSLAEAVWDSMLGQQLERVSPDDTGITGAMLTACVQVAGDWNGAITLQCSKACAETMAAAMFDLPVEELPGTDVFDALGELVNMTGGSVKGMVEGTNTLTLPTVVEGDQSALVLPGTETRNLVVGQVANERLVFRVLTKKDHKEAGEL